MNGFDPTFVEFVILPILIFLARIADVSIGTIRIVFISKGIKNLAPIIGFFEVFIWLLAIGQIMQNLNNWVAMTAYAAGFAAGTYVGMLIEEKLSFGEVLIRIISKQDIAELVSKLKEGGYKITSVSGESETGTVKLILVTAHRKSLDHIIHIVKNYNPETFYTVEDLRTTEEEDYHHKKSIFSLSNLKLHAFKKGK